MCIMVLHKSIIPTYVVAITKNNGNYTAFRLCSKIEIMRRCFPDYTVFEIPIGEI